MNNKTIIEIGFFMMWRIMQISEDVIHRRDLHNSSRPTQSHSIIAKYELFSFIAQVYRCYSY